MTELSQAVAGLDAKKRELLALLAKQRGIDPARAAILPMPRPAPDFPTSFGQERLWFLDRLRPGDPAYNLPMARRLGGVLRPEVLRYALGEVVRRHEILRTRFQERDGRPVQVVLPPAAEAAPLPLVDLSALPPARRPLEAQRLYGDEAGHPFDLENDPLLRARLVRIAAEDHSFLLNLHHIAADGWSLGILFREVTALYEAGVQGRTAMPSVLPVLPIQYADYAAWQREWMRGELLEKHLAYWRRQLAGSPPVLDLPADHPRPESGASRGRRFHFAVPRATAEGVSALGRRTGTTLFMVLLAVFAALLRRISGALDLPVGTPVAGRNRRELEPLIGLFINSLVLRLDLSGDPAFEELLGRVQRVALDAFAHQDLPFEKLVEELRPERALNRQPLFQVMFVFQNTPDSEAVQTAEAAALDSERPAPDFDLSLTCQESGGTLMLDLEYSADLFDPPTVRRFGRQLETLLAGVAEGGGRRLSDLPLLGEEERHQLLVEGHGLPAEPVAACLHERIAAWAAARPEALAIVDGERRITYRELRSRAAGLARFLRRSGIRPEDRVALGIERSAEAIAGILGVLEAGGACVPLDPSHPGERLAGMLADSGASLLLIRRGPAPVWAAGGGGRLRTVALEDLEETAGEDAAGPAVSLLQAAFVLYTSGSTGRPKGVIVEHRALAGYAVEAAAAYGIREGDRCLQLAALSFDAAVEEIGACLAAGGTLVLRPDGMLDSPRRFLAEIERLSIGFADLPTAYWHELAADPAGAAIPPVLRTVVIGGERALGERLALWARIPGASRVRLINTYGPTETTIVATRMELSCSRPSDVPIGRPIPGACAYVVDAVDRALQPQGAPGELWIGGSGLARGYLGQPGPAAAVFVPDPFGFGDAPGGRLYRTGDRVRRRADGALEFLGRIDDQVKVRGFRVEPGEVESALSRHPGVRSAAVVLQGDVGGSPRLVGCVVPADPGDAPAAADLRRFLAGTLPEAMIPAAFAFFPELPLTPHGKVDRRALAREAGQAPAAEREIAAPRTAAEKALAGIWAELLSIEDGQVGVHDGFFDLGGHSLLAARLLSRVRAAFGVELALRTVFEEPTVAALALQIERLQGVEPAPALALVPVPRQAGPSGEPELPLSFAQQRLWFLERLAPGSAYNIPAAFRLRGALDVQALEDAFSAVAARHEVLRTTFPLPQADAEPVQRIGSPRPFPLPRIDLEGCGEGEARRLAAAEALRPFDLERGPVIRAALLRLGPEDHALLATMHHIASDGWSVELLVSEVAALYGRRALPPLPVQYGDYAVWQRSWLAGEALEGELRFWRETLAGAPAVLELPADRARPASPSGRGGLRAAALPAGLREALAAVGKSAGASLFMVLLASWKALLWRVTGQTDLPVGTAVAGRGRVEVERLIGFFVNTLVLRTDLGVEGDGKGDGDGAEGPPFLEAVARVRQTALAAFAHQDLPFERLVQELAPERSLAHAPLFQVLFSLESTAGVGGGETLPGLDLIPFGGPGGEAEERAAKFDLSVAVSDQGAGLVAYLEFNRDLFDGTTAQRLLDGWVRLLEGAAAAPGSRLAELPLLSVQETHQLAFEWNDTSVAYAPDLCLHEWVERQVRITPQAPALLSETEEVTYQDLDRRANRLARTLRRLGVGPDVPVAVHAERSIEMVVGILAVWKAGGAFVPLDPTYPAERLAYLLEDSKAPVVLTQAHVQGSLPASPAVRIVVLEGGEGDLETDADLEPRALPQNLSCIYYTSGSTGRPKGVALHHRGHVRRLLWARSAYRLDASDTVLFKASFGFDFALFEMFGSLLAGARVVIARPGGHQDPEYLVRTLRDRSVTFCHFVPSMLALFLSEPGIEEIRDLRQVICGGEVLTAELRNLFFARLGPAVALDNQYGPTEISIDTTRWVCGAHGADRERERVPIGRPMLNRIHLLDRSLRPVPALAAGALYVAGEGLARGYLGRPALTAERFLPDPWGGSGAGGERLYDTRDLARWRPDGVLDFLGRSDQQVKVRGIRIEPGEIEAVLRQHPEVEAAAVVARQDGNGSVYLSGFFVARLESPLTSAELRQSLRAHLPEAMMPASLQRLEALPVTPSGKLDRQALAGLEAAAPEPGELAVPPRGPAEELLAAIWAEVLGVPEDRIGARDDFFGLGGHSLLATRIVSRVRSVFEVELPLRAVFEVPALADLALRIGQLQHGQPDLAPPLLPVPRRAGPAGEPELPLSFAQQRLWFLERLAPGPAYNIPVALRLRGALNFGALAAALSEVTARHEVLRTAFPDRGEPVQRISAPRAFPLPWIDLAGLASRQAEREASRLAAGEALQPFDLERGPVIRGLLLGLGPEDHAACLTMHHIASDGWSIEVLTAEMSALYAAFSAGRPSPLPPLAVQYGDYAVWQRGWLTEEVIDRQLGFWRQALAGAPAVLELPADRPRPASPSGRGGARAVALPPRLLEVELGGLGRREGASLFMVLLAAWKALLWRFTGQPDLPVGTVVSGRSRIEVERLIGFFVNTLVLRTDLAADLPEGPSFREAVTRVRSTTLAAFAHQDVPFERLVQDLAPERNLTRAPLFQTLFSLEDTANLGGGASAGSSALGYLAMSPFGADAGEERAAKFDLSLSVAGRAVAVLEFNRDLFDGTTAQRLLESWVRLVEGAAADPGSRLAELPLLSAQEIHQLEFEWNDTAVVYPSEPCLHEAVERQVRLTPEAPALISETGDVTYRQLNVRANRLARTLRRLGVGPDVPVAVHAERSVEMVVAILAVWKAGGAFVPLEPAYPAERLAYLLEDSAAPVALTQEHLQGSLPASPGLRAVVLDGREEALESDADLEPWSLPHNLSCLFYTSGSTGRPKGVALHHRGHVRRLLWAQSVYGLGSADRVLFKASFGFDFALFEMFGSLLAGARVVIAKPGGQQDPEYLVRLLREQSVTFCHFVPSMLALFLSEPGIEEIRDLRQVISGGELLSVELKNLFFARFGPAVALDNQYGPTEISIDTTRWVCGLDSMDRDRQRVPIGRPMLNRIHLLDRSLRPVPMHAAGGLYVAGEGLARGYFGRPALTAERFVPSPWGAPGERLYDTRDLARWRPDGALEFLGRSDQQVKVRGIRIEPGEIEAVLRQHPEVEAAAVVAGEDAAGAVLLLGFFVACPGSALTPAELRSHLRGHLPEAMLPASLRRLEEMPLTSSGKLDRQALARFDRAAPEPVENAARLRGPAEELLAAIWSEVLGLGEGRVGSGDDFFALGGHSLLATQVVSRIRAAFGIELPLRAVFEAPTLAVLAARIAGERSAAVPRPAILPVPRPASGEAELPLSFAQQRLWFLDRLEPESPAYNVPAAFRFRGAFDPRALAAALNGVIARHEALRTTFHQRPGSGEPLQRIAPPRPLAFPWIDLSALPDPEREARRLSAEEALRPFDLERGPVLRALLLRLAPEDHVAWLGMHHIVSDGWSFGVLTAELGALYAAALAGRPSPLPPLPVQYGDFAAWQRAWHEAGGLEDGLRFWRERLAGAPPVLEIPADRPRPAVPSGRGASLDALLPASTAAALHAFCRRASVTPFMALLAAWKTLLYRSTGQEDLLVGTPVANRDRAELEGLIGFFGNTLVLRSDLSGEPSFLDLVARVREGTLAAFSYQDVPFEQLVEELSPERSLAYSPLFQVLFVVNNNPGGALDLPDVSLSPFGFATATAKFDLAFFATEMPGALLASVEYSTDLFDAVTVRRLLEHWSVLLAAALSRPEERLGDLPLLGEPERHQLVAEWNEPCWDAAPAAPAAIVDALFEREAELAPGRIAIVAGEEELSYAEVSRRAAALARRLRIAGVKPDMPVGVFLERGWEIGVALLAVLRAQGCYLPLDPSYPAERLAFMLEDSGAPFVITRERLVPALPAASAQAVTIESALADEPDGAARGEAPADALSYVVYTSGSTGTPKGVALPHRTLANLAAWQVGDSVLPRRTGARTLQYSSSSFDVSLQEVFTTWAAGGTLVVATAEHRRDPEALLAWMREARVERLFLPYVALQQLAEAWMRGGALPADLREVMTAGEQLLITPEIAAFFRALPGCVLFNHYGPSETHAVTSHKLSGDPGGWPALPPIGRPIAGTSVRVLDRWLRPAPIGIPGEVWLGGVMLARGYLGRPDRTAERFLPDPFCSWAGQPGARLYRTGDLARLGPGGEIELLGRIDHQVKIRGFRVEPGEIEVALGAHPAVREAAVVVRGEGARRRLAAWVIPEDPAAPREALAESLRSFLRERLPDYMVPASFAALEAFPMTPSGKVDRRALARLEPETAAAAGPSSPRTPVEEVLAGIWCDVLGIETVSPGDDFFRLSGHSLLATQVVYRARQAFGVDLPLRRLFEGATLAELALEIEEAARSGREGSNAPEVPRLQPLPAEQKAAPLPVSLSQEFAWRLQGGPVGSQLTLPLGFRVRGALDFAALQGAFAEVVRRHESLRLRFFESGGEIFAELLPFAVPPMPVADLSGLPETAREAEVTRLAEANAAREFDLRTGQVVTSTVLRLGESDHAVLFNMHHIVSDGWSLEVFQRELVSAYHALARRQAPALPPLPVQLTDYADWQRHALSGEALAAQLEYWRQRLAGSPPPLELPTRRARPAGFQGGVAACGLRFTAESERELRGLARSTGGSMPMLLLAAYFGVLQRYSGRDDLVTGSVFSGRSRPELAGLIGLFMNTVALRADLSGSPSFREVVSRVRETVLGAYTHSDVPYPRVLAMAAPDRRFDRLALSRTLFNLLSYPAPNTQAAAAAGPGPDLAFEELVAGAPKARYDLILECREAPGSIQCTFIGAADLFTPEDLADVCRDFEALLFAAAADPDAPLDRLLPAPHYLRAL